MPYQKQIIQKYENDPYSPYSWALQKLEVNRESTKSIYMKTFR